MLKVPCPLARLALFAVGVLAMGAVAAEDSRLQGLDEYVEKGRQDWRVPGVAVVVVKDDAVVYAKGFGVREIGKRQPVDVDTVFAVGSSSKAVTAAALGILVDEGKVEWDGHVSSYIPSFELYDPYVTRELTVRDLLCHRSGVAPSPLLWTGSGFGRDEIVRRLRFQRKSNGFRNNFEYNNEMYIVAGQIIPAVTGKSWDEFLAERIFRPLGMTRTNTSVRLLPAMQNVARPHVLLDGKMVPIEYRLIDNAGGAGAINSSARDMAQWVRLQLSGGLYEGARVIQPETVAQMQTPQMPLRSGSFSEMMPAAHIAAYGLGWFIHDYQNRKVVQHAGAIDGMLGVVGMIPEEKLGVVILTNRYPHQLVYALEFRIFDAFLGVAPTDWSAVMKASSQGATARMAAAAAPEQTEKSAHTTLPLQSYVGTYASPLYGEARISLEGGRLVLIRGASAAVLEHWYYDTFRADWKSNGMASILARTPVAFSISPVGTVASLEILEEKFVHAGADPAASGRSAAAARRR